MMSINMIFVCVVSSVFTKHQHQFKPHHHPHLADILNVNENFFSKTNKYIQNTLNRIFEELNIPKQFTDEAKIKLLLTMHYDLNNIAEKNFEIFDVLRNVTTVFGDNKAVNKIRLDEMVREILSQINSKVHDDKKVKKDKPIVRSSTSKRPPMPGFNDSQEFKEFIKGFLGKIKRLTVKDLFKKKSSSKLMDSSRRNLKVWEPPVDLLSDWPANNFTSRRIFRGKKTNIETFPFVASVHILEDFMCAGSIIARDLVLTAASCVQIHYNNRYFRENPKTTYVRIGSEWTSRRGELVPVLEIFFYPTYDPKTLKHNIALLRLERTIKFESRRRSKIRRIQLDRGEGNLPANTRDVVILGWGARKPNQIINTFEKLTVAFLNIYPVDECRNIYSKEYVTDTNFCAGFMSRGGGACNRDVGAPGVVGGLLVGIVSFGAPVCGALDAPTVYTRVGPFKNWIEKIMADHPLRFGKPKTTKMTSRALIYYFNTMTTRTYPHIKPISPTRFHPLALRAQDENEPLEEDILQEIITNIIAHNDTMIHEILDQDLVGDFYDISESKSGENFNIIQHPLINKTLYLIPGIHFTPTAINETTTNIEPTYLFETTTPIEPVSNVNLRITGKSIIDDDDNNNYESASKEEHVPADSEESRQEYFEKQLKTTATIDDYDEDSQNNDRQLKITQPIYVDPKGELGDDYSRDVEFEI